jgi:hypothetical protein
MVALLPSPVLQFSDSNGVPLAGGSIATYLPGTTTPVTTWSESTGTSANSNPIVLDSAGECSIYASGIVRMILHDAAGNLIFDQPSNTLVSNAMAPVCIAVDLPTARTAMGITAAIATETSARITADAATLATAVADIAVETTRAEAAEATNATAIATERTRALAAEAALGAHGTPTWQSGSAITSGGGTVTVTFGTPFATSCTAVAFAVVSGSVGCWVQLAGAPSTTGFSAASMSPLFGGSWLGGPVTFYWIATGT